MSINLDNYLVLGYFLEFIFLCLEETSGNGTKYSPWSNFDPSGGVCICPDTIHGVLHCDESGCQFLL